MRFLLTAIVVAFSFTTSGCSSDSKAKNDGTLSVIATTGQINSALQKITNGAKVDIKLFCGPGVDPHSFSASTKDVKAMEEADAIFYNGFHLEAKLHDLFHDRYKDKAWAMSSAFPEKDRMEWIDDGEDAPNPDAPYDPHIWNHLPAWAECVKALAKRMGELDEANRELYAKNGEAYAKELMEAHEWAKGELSKLPEDRRFLVSAHDAFNYFAKLYGLEPIAVLGISNDAEADIKTMRGVAETICEKKIPVIFLESITNPKVTEALKEACTSRGWNVTISDQPLYSDDLGEASPVNTFLGAFRSNVTIISESLAK